LQSKFAIGVSLGTAAIMISRAAKKSFNEVAITKKYICLKIRVIFTTLEMIKEEK